MNVCVSVYSRYNDNLNEKEAYAFAYSGVIIEFHQLRCLFDRLTYRFSISPEIEITFMRRIHRQSSLQSSERTTTTKTLCFIVLDIRKIPLLIASLHKYSKIEMVVDDYTR